MAVQITADQMSQQEKARRILTSREYARYGGQEVGEYIVSPNTPAVVYEPDNLQGSAFGIGGGGPNVSVFDSSAQEGDTHEDYLSIFREDAPFRRTGQPTREHFTERRGRTDFDIKDQPLSQAAAGQLLSEGLQGLSPVPGIGQFAKIAAATSTRTVYAPERQYDKVAHYQRYEADMEAEEQRRGEQKELDRMEMEEEQRKKDALRLIGNAAISFAIPVGQALNQRRASYEREEEARQSAKRAEDDHYRRIAWGEELQRFQHTAAGRKLARDYGSEPPPQFQTPPDFVPPHRR